ncbi:hypothetical protein QYS48_01405 [Marivirga arenosa]|uniref:Uncharacterized protein n=1 Tax=Marivirga arenosa TaxID=3059076 RepID=A0AA49GGQ8_9BACT|nr:hypothetical protein [Marivirga sp. ABR2-2]WKK85775.1 hypothetical protein QYS48_01405 [Marivirga sp. ABR2-2]
MIYDLSLLLLAYTRNKEAFDFLVKEIQNDATNCSAANPSSNKKISCAYRIMEAVAPAIQNFPIPTDDFGSLMVENYETALTELRAWFNENSNYQIIQDTY